MTDRTKEYIAWFEAIFNKKIRNACKNFFTKIFILSLGVLLMIAGLYFLLTTIPSLTSIAGGFLVMFGLVLFIIPFGVDWPSAIPHSAFGNQKNVRRIILLFS